MCLLWTINSALTLWMANDVLGSAVFLVIMLVISCLLWNFGRWPLQRQGRASEHHISWRYLLNPFDFGYFGYFGMLGHRHQITKSNGVTTPQTFHRVWWLQPALTVGHSMNPKPKKVAEKHQKAHSWHSLATPVKRFCLIWAVFQVQASGWSFASLSASIFNNSCGIRHDLACP